jgi:hypothetical protein
LRGTAVKRLSLLLRKTWRSAGQSQNEHEINTLIRHNNDPSFLD